MGDPALLQHGAAIGHSQCQVGLLVDDQDGDAGIAQVAAQAVGDPAVVLDIDRLAQGVARRAAVRDLQGPQHRGRGGGVDPAPARRFGDGHADHPAR